MIVVGGVNAQVPLSQERIEREARMSLTLEEIATLVDGRVEDGTPVEISGISALADAGPTELGFLSTRRYLPEAAEAHAGALLVSEEVEALGALNRPRVVVGDGHRALRVLVERFHPPVPVEPGVHPMAVVDASAVLGQDVVVGPFAVIGAGAWVGDRAQIGAHVVVGRGARLGDDTVLHPHVVLYDGAELGSHVIIHAGAKIGVDGFGYVFEDGQHKKVPQVGACTVADGVEIGANSCVDRGSIGRTEIGPGCKLDNLVQVAHNVHIGPLSILTAQVGIAGSTRIGSGAMFAGQSGAVGHIRIGDGVKVAAKTAVAKDVPDGETVMGVPSRPIAEYMKAQAAGLRMDRVRRVVRDLSRRVAALEAAQGLSDD